MLLLIINAHNLIIMEIAESRGHIEQKKNLNNQIKNFVLEDRMKGNGGQTVYTGF